MWKEEEEEEENGLGSTGNSLWFMGVANNRREYCKLFKGSKPGTLLGEV